MFRTFDMLRHRVAEAGRADSLFFASSLSETTVESVFGDAKTILDSAQIARDKLDEASMQRLVMTVHKQRRMLAQRIFSIALGYEDLVRRVWFHLSSGYPHQALLRTLSCRLAPDSG